MRYYVWQQENYLNLLEAYKKNHLPHAVIFSGEVGLGKLDLAKYFSKTILCSKKKERDSDKLSFCNICQSCHLFDLGHHADFKLIQPEETSAVIKIDQVRAASEFVQHTAQRGEYKIIIINLAEQLNIAGTNALLKSLEEPQGKTLFILITEKISSLLPTLLSRCQKISFTPPSAQIAKSWLLESMAPGLDGEDKQDKQEQFDTARLDLALYLANNAPLRAKEILILEQDVTFKSFTKDLISYFCQAKSVVEFSEVWHKYDLNLIINFMQLVIIYLIKQVSGVKNSAELFSLPNQTKQKIFEAYRKQDLSNMYQKMIEIKQALIKKVSLNQQFAIESVLLV